jgi:subtilisin family serine protease
MNRVSKRRKGSGRSVFSRRVLPHLELLEVRSLLSVSVPEVTVLGGADAALAPQATTTSDLSGSLWGLTKTRTGSTAGTSAAWDLTTGSTHVTVADVDTGIDYAHPDLYRNVWLNQGEIPSALRASLSDGDGDQLITFRDLNLTANAGYVTDLNGNGRVDAGDLLADPRWDDGSDGDGNGYRDDLVGWDFANNDNDPFDDNGHGSHTAGTIGATANDGGVVGVNWDVQVMPVKFLGADGSGAYSAAAAAIRYAVDNGAKVSNNSWGGGNSADVYSACVYARDHGHLIVAAAGNNGYNNDTSPFRNYPASYDLTNIIAVAATDSSDAKASWSNYGKSSVDLGAPGVGIVSTVPVAKDTDGNPDGYASYSGTSMATPHVSGAAALILARNGASSATGVKSLILNNVDKVKSLSNKVVTGGRLNTYRAVAATAAGSPPAVAGTPGGSTASFSTAPVAAGRAAVAILGDVLIGRAGGEALAVASNADLLA